MAEASTSPAGDAPKSWRRGIVNRVKETATAQLASQKNRGTDALDRLAGAVRSTTRKLREERHDTVAGYIDHAANRIENWAERLREKDVEDLISDLHRLARRQPAVFIGSAFALGLLAGRFLKSSRPGGDGYERSVESRRTTYGGATAGPSTVHDYSSVRHTDAGLTGAAAADPGSDAGMPTGGAEAARSVRTRRSPSRTGQP